MPKLFSPPVPRVLRQAEHRLSAPVQVDPTPRHPRRTHLTPCVPSVIPFLRATAAPQKRPQARARRPRLRFGGGCPA